MPLREGSNLFRKRYMSNSPALVFLDTKLLGVIYTITFWSVVYNISEHQRLMSSSSKHYLIYNRFNSIFPVSIAYLWRQESSLHFSFRFTGENWIWCLWRIRENGFQVLNRNITSKNARFGTTMQSLKWSLHTEVQENWLADSSLVQYSSYLFLSHVFAHY